MTMMMMNKSKKEFPRLEQRQFQKKSGVGGWRGRGEEDGCGGVLYSSQKLALLTSYSETMETGTHTNRLNLGTLTNGPPACLRGRLRCKKTYICVAVAAGTPFIASVSGRVESLTLATDMKKGLELLAAVPLGGARYGATGLPLLRGLERFFFFLYFFSSIFL